MKSMDEISLGLAVSAHRQITSRGINTDPKRETQFVSIIQVAINQGIEEYIRQREGGQ